MWYLCKLEEHNGEYEYTHEVLVTAESSQIDMVAETVARTWWGYGTLDTDRDSHTWWDNFGARVIEVASLKGISNSDAEVLLRLIVCSDLTPTKEEVQETIDIIKRSEGEDE